MAGIYIHIPFCRRACHYCDFHFTTNLKNSEDLVSAIVREIQVQKDYLKQETISTIYFGGGTPSLLLSSEIARIIDEIGRHHQLESDLELTLEANPEDLNLEKLKELKQIGVNRLSLGTQSFIDAELTWMNRMHSSAQAIRSIHDAQHVGFDNISIDLIFGLPQQTIQDWEFNLAAVEKLNVQHISSYSLTVEKKTVLNDRIKKGLESWPSDDSAMRMFKMNMEVLPSIGFEQYEISNYAKDGFISRHNSSYWKGVKYLGLGPSAHSYDLVSRQWNLRSNAGYVKAIASSESHFEREELSTADKLNDILLTRLRTKWGVDREMLESVKSGTWSELVHQLASLDAELFVRTENLLKLSDAGKLVADRLTSDLFFDQ